MRGSFVPELRWMGAIAMPRSLDQGPLKANRFSRLLGVIALMLPRAGVHSKDLTAGSLAGRSRRHQCRFQCGAEAG